VVEKQTATGLGEKQFLGQIVPDNSSGNAAIEARGLQSCSWR